MTGAASGIGKAIATRFAADGACVVIADLDLDKARAAAAEIGGTDVAIGVQADVTDEAQIAAASRGRRAGLRRAGPRGQQRRALAVQVRCSTPRSPTGTCSTTSWPRARSWCPRPPHGSLIDQELGGDIVYISSKNSVFAGPNNIAYSATKADQAHQVRLLAAELGEHGVKVNGINPDGVVRGSGIFAGGWGAKRAAVYGVPEEELGQVLRPAHPAQARGAARERRQRRRSCSPAATSRHTTGLHIPVDAGVAAAFLR